MWRTHVILATQEAEMGGPSEFLFQPNTRPKANPMLEPVDPSLYGAPSSLPSNCDYCLVWVTD